VAVGSARAPLTFVSDGQINAQAPVLPLSGSVTVSVIAHCGQANETTSPSVSVPVATAAPEFLYFVTHADGRNPVAAIQALTGAYVASAGLLPGLTFAPARAGDVLTIFGVGFGPTISSAPPGMLAAAAADTVGAGTVTIGGIAAKVLYTGLTPTFAGLYQVSIVVPSGVAPGDQPVVIQVNGETSPIGAYLTIQ